MQKNETCNVEKLVWTYMTGIEVCLWFILRFMIHEALSCTGWIKNDLFSHIPLFDSWQLMFHFCDQVCGKNYLIYGIMFLQAFARKSLNNITNKQ